MSVLASEGIEVRGALKPGYDEILTPDALRFLASLADKFEPTRKQLLKAREIRQKEIDSGKLPSFLEETKAIREKEWKVAKIPKDLEDRRVEITGPVSRKMVINALNCGAKVFMADFEDATSPTWDNNVQGQINLRDAVRGTISFTGPDGKVYKPNAQVATLMVRPRGWHLEEHHLFIKGQPMSGSMFDFGLYFFHNAKNLIAKGSGPYFYLPKMESHKEARLWASIFEFSEKALGIPHGSIRATCLIETVMASFEMDEFLYELRDYSAGLNCGRWDYIFSFIKKFYRHREFVLPDRDEVTMLQPFMNNYVQKLIATCHRRGIHAMGGMAAQIPSRDPVVNKTNEDKIRNDKLREVKAGHDGTWVAHPNSVTTAMEVFNEHMKTPNQIQKVLNVNITEKDLMLVPKGNVTLNGIKSNVRVGILYLEAWLRGEGAVGINNLMEDLATAEICRSQLQQWMKHQIKTKEGTVVTPALVRSTLDEEVSAIQKTNQHKSVLQAKEIFEKILFNNNDQFGDFMSLFAYPYLVQKVNAKL